MYFENFQEVISEVPYLKFTDLQTVALRIFKAPKVASMVESFSSEAGANPAVTGRKFNVRKMFRRRPGRPMNVLCTFNLRPVSTGNGYSTE